MDLRVVVENLPTNLTTLKNFGQRIGPGRRRGNFAPSEFHHVLQRLRRLTKNCCFVGRLSTTCEHDLAITYMMFLVEGGREGGRDDDDDGVTFLLAIKLF